MTPAVPAPVRATDPATSHAGAQAPHLPRQRRDVLVMLVAAGLGTKWTIADDMVGVESGTVASRLSQLEAMGLVEKAGTRPGPRGRPVTEWRPTPEGRRVVAAGMLPDGPEPERRRPRCPQCGDYLAAHSEIDDALCRADARREWEQ